MLIGIPKEIKVHEHRVGLAPGEPPAGFGNRCCSPGPIRATARDRRGGPTGGRAPGMAQEPTRDDDRPHQLSAWDAIQAIGAGRLRAEELVRSCLARIEAMEPTIRAWAFLDPDLAIAQARRLDQGPRRGPLHGLPIGIKDVIDTADMPTAYGSLAYEGWRPAWDAACVALLRRAGAVIMGKTVTTEFACGGAADNANPWNPAHTAGGSSGGSCAAVAAQMVPLAIGSQTAGSLIRPASYNGVVALKPTFGMISVAGFKYFNGLLDTIGLVARGVDDVALLWASLLDLAPERPAPPAEAPSFGLCRTPWWGRAEPSTRAAVKTTAERLADDGAPVVEVNLPSPFENLVDVHERIQAYETARSYAYEYDRFRDELHANTRALIEEGLSIPYGAYLELVATAARARAKAHTLFEKVEVLLAPSAPGEAPEGHTELGNSFLNRPWTLLHLPCLNVPGLFGPKGLPIGVQLIGPFGADAKLLATAGWVETRIALPGR